jgi:hypothetical protein
VNIERFRGRANRRQYAVADLVANSPEQAATQPCLLANVFEQKGGRGFSIRAGHGSELEPERRPVIKRGGQIGECVARVLRHKAGRVRMLDLALRHDHRGAFFDGLFDELVTVAFFPA